MGLAAPEKRRGFILQGRLLGWTLSAPLLLVLVAIMAFPFGFMLYISFTDWAANVGPWWKSGLSGIQNYTAAIHDSRLLSAFLRTFFIAGCAVALEGLIGLALALIVAEKLRAHRIFTMLFLLPMMVVPAVAGFIFFMLFQSAGPVNGALGLLTGGTVAISWLSHSNSALFVAILADVWQWTPLMFLIFLSGILSVPPNLYDATEALGASAWQRFRFLTFPWLKQVIVIAIIIRGIEALKIFDVVFLLTKGGPGTSTETISMYLYELAFRQFRFAYATAASLLILIPIILLALRATAYLQKAEERAT